MADLVLPPVLAERPVEVADLRTVLFADFYREGRDRIARALTLTLGDRDLALDAVDEAMARAYQRWSRVGSLDNPGGWVYRVALNWSCSVLRRRRRAPRPRPDREVTDVGPISEPSVLRALAELDVRQRAVVVCRHLLGWSEAETALALSTPVGTVKSRLHRANQILARRLDHLRSDSSNRSDRTDRTDRTDCTDHNDRTATDPTEDGSTR